MYEITALLGKYRHNYAPAVLYAIVPKLDLRIMD